MYKKWNISYINTTNSYLLDNTKSYAENRAIQILHKIHDMNLKLDECIAIDDLDLRPYLNCENFIWIKNGVGLYNYFGFQD